MSVVAKLDEMKRLTGEAQTVGLSKAVIEQFLHSDPRLAQAIDQAYLTFHELSLDPAIKQQLLDTEENLVKALQKDVVNFYSQDVVNPYVPISAIGPWIITSHGAVLHDSGGYGMLGFGQNHPTLLNTLNQQQVMANIMTASFSQQQLIKALHQEVGHTRGKQSAPYQFLFLNSGSEGVTLASRLSDLNAFSQTQEGAVHAGKKSKFMSMQGSFHGRTDRPAQVSDSSRQVYLSSLKSFQQQDNLVTVKANDINQLEDVFEREVAAGNFVEAVFIEPVMGEGDPGIAISPEFYLKAKMLTERHGGLLIIDSVQAGLRATGYLSIIDYPGFRELPPPDVEVFSKAINCGQFPLSIVALGERAQEIFKIGLYGNTMTGNPRALDVASQVLSLMTDAVRKNIAERGIEAVEKFTSLQQRYSDVIEAVQGTGLLFCVKIAEDKAKVVANNGLETWLRKNGIGVIHGGKNALRFTPNFTITSEEVDLLVKEVEKAIVTAIDGK